MRHGEAARAAPPSRRWSRPLLGAVATVVLAVAGAACSSDGDAGGLGSSSPSRFGSSSLPADSTAVTTAVPVATTATTPAPPTAASTVPVDGGAVLTAAVAALAPGYHYRSVATVGDATVVEAEGDRVGDGTRLAVVRDGAAVQYVITPDGTWVMPDGGEWDQLDTPAATTDPIAALGAPAAVAVLAEGPEVVTLAVTVPVASLGVAGDATTDLTVTITQGALTSLAYRTTIDGQDAAVETTVGPVVDGSPVVAPV